ncbi:hypothetical protein A3709_14800 [Halioglobus sp. HI00S01]|uniref:leucine-rich repeat domain-containing protein n=1 Tax=Halioglobus sp. HI00S01 TaxID=1822214 RepID=UPI0007C4063A|nr:leucine-rich repeat domain-containing protein [Halioglobus sp. HI00S01]KZX59552.1 hypothetical protein A3709_14800 [Halioglobus sp. HI00S01]
MIQRILTVTALLLLAGCGSYDLSVNDRVVYTPRPLFSEYTIADPALASCVQNEIERLNITHASQLRDLNCSDSNVADLSGIEVFTGLSRLILRDNSIASVAPLGKLSLVIELDLRSNQIVDPRPLYDLPALQSLDLRGNGSLTCPGGGALLQLDTLTLPGHCPQR